MPDFTSLLKDIQNFIRPSVEITIISVMLYFFYLLIKKTKAVQVIKGLLILGIGFFLAKLFNLHTIDWLLTRVLTISVIAFVVIFQPELRSFLERIGQGSFTFHPIGEESIVDILIKTAKSLADKKIGALIVIEKNVSLESYTSAGVILNSRVSSDLLQTIFMPHTPLHDGGVIISGNKIVAASCLFPLSQREDLSRSLGTRHRAAVGLSEETDALTIVVSEETGLISVARDGSISRNIDETGLRRILNNLYITDNKKKPMMEMPAK